MSPLYQRPYTLVVDLDGLLVHSQWDVSPHPDPPVFGAHVQRQHGWRAAKRPGVDYFLAYLSQFYEIVLFTSQPLYVSLNDESPHSVLTCQVAAPISEKLDPLGMYLPYKLFRDNTRYVNNKVVKDLSYLNRDLSKVC